MEITIEHINSRLENVTWDALQRMHKSLGWNVLNVLGSYEDECNGTDFIVNYVRVDVTSMDKDLERLKATFLGEYRKAGIVCYAHAKRSNGKIDFEEPVLMLHFEPNKALYDIERLTEFYDFHYFDIVDKFLDVTEEE